MTPRPLTIAMLWLLALMSACSTDGREMDLPLDNQNQSIITTTLPVDDGASFDTATP